MARLLVRAIGAARLNMETYDEVEKDPAATAQALAVLAVACLAAAVTSLVLSGPTEAAAVAIAQPVFLLVAISAAYLVGSRLLPEPQRFKGIYASDDESGTPRRATFGEFFRATGFAYSPAVFIVLRVVPLVGAVAFWAVSIWLLWAVAGAVQHALNYSSFWRAWFVWFISAVLGTLVSFMVAGVCIVIVRALVG